MPGAGGTYFDAGGAIQLFVVTETNGVWGSAIRVPGIGRLAIGKEAGIDSMSCKSPGTCSAGGSYLIHLNKKEPFVVNQS